MSRTDVVECKADFSKYKNLKESTMIVKDSRKVVEIQLIDDDPGLPVEMSLVAKFSGIITECDEGTTIRELLMKDDSVSKALNIHNKIRVEILDEEILTRTGNEVKLRPIKLKDLRWVVK